MSIIEEEATNVPYYAGLAGVPAAISRVSSIDGQKGILKYRGISVQELVEKSTFSETAFLLIFGKLPTQVELDTFNIELMSHRRLKYKMIDLIKTLPDNGHPMDATQCLLAALGMYYPFASKNFKDPKIQYTSIIRLISKLPTIVAAFDRMRLGNNPVFPSDSIPNHAGNFLYMLFEKVPNPDQVRILEQALILHMEHTMNASTFSARVTASTLCDPFTVISSAIGTLTGPLHGGANEQVLDMLREIGSISNVEPYLVNKLNTKGKIMGFGHREYKVKDPRATILQGLAEKLFNTYGYSPLYEVALEVEKVMEKLVGSKGIYPNVDFYSGLVYQRLGINEDIFTPIFAVARVVGWLAHWVEQMQDNRIYRPTAIYKDDAEVVYTPISTRG